MTESERAELQVLTIALQVITESLDNLVSECLDGDNIKAPSKRAIIEARKMLPPKYKNTLTKTVDKG